MRGTSQGCEEGDEEEAPVEVVALEEQPQVGGGAATLVGGDRKSVV